ncbi:stage II sporulation protein R [Bacillus manliponensis]|uniref:stage II sporulation protein R n=1 Tax=Bacillus manliponensis TaxID=574376 RepID=UPI0035170B5F
MKKKVIAYFLILLIGAQVLGHFEYMKADAKGPLVIPDEAIRLRILANSDSKEDQELKRKVRDEVKAQIDGWVADLKSFEEAREVIKSRLPELEETVANTLKSEGSKEPFQVKFSKHVKFPTKMYGNFIYPAGEYEAVLITIGEGEGANWWCVLFPPMCFVDFSSGTAVKAKGHSEEVLKEEVDEEKQETIEEEKVNLKELEEKVVVNEQQVKRVLTKEEESVEETVKKEDDEVKDEQDKKEKEDGEIRDKQDKKQKIEVEEEEETEVKLFVVEVFSSLFSK